MVKEQYDILLLSQSVGIAAVSDREKYIIFYIFQ